MFGEIFGRSAAPGEASITWTSLTEVEEINEVIQASHDHPVLIFKHSTRCGTSAMALDRLQRKWEGEAMSSIKTYMVNVITDREVSNRIAELLGVWHQSPQVLLLSQGTSVYDNSHMGISYEEIKAEAAALVAKS